MIIVHTAKTPSSTQSDPNIILNFIIMINIMKYRDIRCHRFYGGKFRHHKVADTTPNSIVVLFDDNVLNLGHFHSVLST